MEFNILETVLRDDGAIIIKGHVIFNGRNDLLEINVNDIENIDILFETRKKIING